VIKGCVLMVAAGERFTRKGFGLDGRVVLDYLQSSNVNNYFNLN